MYNMKPSPAPLSTIRKARGRFQDTDEERDMCNNITAISRREIKLSGVRKGKRKRGETKIRRQR